MVSMGLTLYMGNREQCLAVWKDAQKKGIKKTQQYSYYTEKSFEIFSRMKEGTEWM